MPLGNRRDKESRQSQRQEYKIDKINALTQKAKAVASKRKWLVILLIVGIAVFTFIKSKGIF
jgi:hypothetical protein